MNPFASETIQLIKLAHSASKKISRAELLTVDENKALEFLRPIDVVGILLDNLALYKEFVVTFQKRLATIAEQSPCIGLEMAHDGLNCVHCLAKENVQVKVTGTPPDASPTIKKG